MKRQMISFAEAQEQHLSDEAKRLGVSVSELVRRIVDWYIDTYPPISKIEIEPKGNRLT